MWWVYHSSWWYEYTCTVSFVLFNIYLHIMVSPNMHKKVNKQSNRSVLLYIYIRWMICLSVIYHSMCLIYQYYYIYYKMNDMSISDLSLYVSDCISTVVYFCDWLMLIRPVFSSSDLCVWLYKYCSLLQWLIDVN